MDVLIFIWILLFIFLIIKHIWIVPYKKVLMGQELIEKIVWYELEYYPWLNTLNQLGFKISYHHTVKITRDYKYINDDWRIISVEQYLWNLEERKLSAWIKSLEQDTTLA